MGMKGFSKFVWGFFFTMFDFRINGVDILPDVVGYILFFVGLSMLSERCGYFQRARNFNLPVLILSIFSIYQAPTGSGMLNYFNSNIVGFIAGIAIVILDLLMVYNICLGIQDIALLSEEDQVHLASEAQRRWKQYLLLVILSFSSIILIIIPTLLFFWVIVMIIYNIVIMVLMMNFMRRCENEL